MPEEREHPMTRDTQIRRGTASALALASLILPAGALADASAPAATTKGFANQTLWLDSHRASAADNGIVRTSQRLRRGARYTVTVKGTASYYSPASYAPRRPLVLCGKPERAAMFRSPGAVNGPVGVDPEFVFARPWTRSQCSRVPGHWSNFQINTNRYFFHPTPRAGTPRAARSDHSYTYTVVGRGRVAAFRLVDRADTRDNYGVFRIGIKAATS